MSLSKWIYYGIPCPSSGLSYHTVKPISSLLARTSCLAAILFAFVSPALHAANGTWLADADGNWNTAGNWSSAIIATGSGSTATFTNNITRGRTITLNAPITIGKLVFSDGDSEWTLAGTSPLTLAISSGIPEINTTDQTTHIAASLVGAAFMKSGSGILELSGANSFSPSILTFPNDGSIDSGSIRIIHSNALDGISNVSLPGTNNSVSRIDLAGNVTLNTPLSTSGRGATSFLRNISDNNTWNGQISISNSGGGYGIESQAGMLTVGPIVNAIGSTRAMLLTGDGNGIAAGVISDGTGGSLGITKSGAGNWKFSAANTYTGPTLINSGTLEITTGGNLGSAGVTNNSNLIFSQSADLIVSNAISGNGILTVASSGSLTFSGNNTYVGGTIVTAGGTVSVANNSALGTGPVQLGFTPGSSQLGFQSAGNHTIPNNFEIRTQRWIISNSIINGNTAGDLAITGAVFLNQAGAKDIYCNRNLTLNGPLTSTGGLIKKGGSLLTITGAASYSGDTAVNEGTLRLDGSITSAGTTTVSTGTTLTGIGTLSGLLSISSGGDFIPGNGGAGTFTCGKLTLSSGSDVFLTMGSPTDSTNTKMIANGNLNLSSNATIHIANRSGFTSGIYTIATFIGSLTGSGLPILALPPGYAGILSTSTPHQLNLEVFRASPVSPLNNVMLSMTGPATNLAWTPMVDAVGYDVYVGTDSATVAAAGTGTTGIYRSRTNITSFSANGFSNGVTNYWRIDYVLADGAILKGPVWNFTLVVENDLMADTWAATDALNRVLPDAAQAGPPRDDRPIAIFYFLWHTKKSLGSDGPRDNTTEINRLGGYSDKRNPWADNPLWMSGSNGRSWYWAQPENGYYSSDDEWVIRRHISMLVAAGVDILAFDNTNGHPELYQAAYTKIAETIRKMRKEGMKIDLKFLFVTHGGTGGSPATINWLYQNFYKPGLYPELWLMWNGKPAITGYPDGLSPGDVPLSAEVRDFFTLRTSWADVSNFQDEWQWIDSVTPQNWGYDARSDIPEQVPVACGGWCNSNLGRSFSNHSQPSYDNFHLTTARSEGLGKFYDEQSFYGRKLDPQLLFISGWNEWWAGAWTAPGSPGGYNILDNHCAAGQRYFVDNYTAEYSRDIEPMKGGFGDNYYFQMVAQNRLRKGVRTLPFASPAKTISSPADFADITPVYYDAPNETLPRDAPTTFFNLPNYTNTTGRTDFRVMKVARDSTNLYFFAQTKNPITAPSGDNWMMLFLDTDQSRLTGWEGYDYAINLGGSGQVKHFANTTWSPSAAGSATVNVSGNQIIITVPRATVGLTANPLKFDFHWADNIQTNGDITEFSTNGDSAPERRFNYRYQTTPEELVTLRKDGFEPGDDSSNGATSSWKETFGSNSQWAISSSTPYTGTGCLIGTGSATTTDASGTLINRVSTAGLNSLRVAFRYKLANVKDAQNIQIFYRSSNGQWVPVRELSRDQFYPAGQAWSYDERQNVWLYFSDSRLNSVADAKYFHSDFAIHIQIKGLGSSTQTVALDDFQITGTRNVDASGVASNPTPSQDGTSVPPQTILSWTPGTGATTQNIYFGSTGNLTLLGNVNGSTTTQAPPTLSTNTTYQWRVDSVNVVGTTPGPTWSFTTALPSNSAPLLPAIPDQEIIAGQTLTFIAAGTDSDLPAQVLVYSLVSPPAGASVNPTTGAFSWRPTQLQAPGTLPITLVVTDNGTPAHNAQRTFNVQIHKPVVPTSSAFHHVPGGAFSFQINGDSGPDYKVWASENLKEWTLLQTYLSATPPLQFGDAAAKDFPKRFYRIELGP